MALPLAFGGCAIVPPVVGAIAYGIDGISLLVSGKTTTDHAVSAMVEQDCRLWRLLILEAACRPEESEAETAIALAEAAVEISPSSFSAPAAQSRVAMPVPAVALAASGPLVAPPILQPRAKPGAGFWPPVTFDAATPAVPTTPAPPPAPAVRRAAEPVRFVATGERYLVLGTFRQRANAETLAGRLLDAGAVITSPEPGVGQFHRVVVGPLDRANLPGLRLQIQARGVNGAWPATLCLDANAVERSCDPAPVIVQATMPPRPAVTMARAATPAGAQIAARTLALSTDPIY